MKKNQTPLLISVILLLLFSLGQSPAALTWHNEPTSQFCMSAIDPGRVDSSSALADEAGRTTICYFYEPFPLAPGSHVFQLGGSFSLLPYPDMEQELPIPALDVQYKRGLFSHLALDGTLSTNIFSTLLHAGPQLQTKINRFSCGVADHIGGVYSFIKREKVFDRVDAYAIFDMMILRFGYRFDDFSVSVSFVATYVFKSRSYVNGLKAPGGPERSVNDYWCTFAVEQPFMKSLHVSVGMSVGYTRTPYQTWMLYSTVDEWLFAPEFFFAIQL